MSVSSADEKRADVLHNTYGVDVRILTAGVVRLLHEGKFLDLYKNRYFIPTTGERGGIGDEDALIREHFNL